MKLRTAITAVLVMTAAVAIAQEREGGWQRDGDRAGRDRGQQGSDRAGPGMQGRMNEGGRGGQHGDMMERLLSNPEIREKLGLSEEQVAEIRKELQEIKEEMIDLQAEMQKIGLRQAEAMTSKEIDEKKLMKMVEEAGELRTEMAKLQIRKMILFRKHVDPEKMEQVRGQMKERMKERFKDRMGDRGGDNGGRRPEGMGRDREGGDDQRRQRMEEMRRRRAAEAERDED